MVIVQSIFSLSGSVVSAHVIDVVRQDDVQVLKFLEPRRLPLQRYVSGIVYALQRAHDLVHREVALADQFELIFAARVSHVDVLYVCSEVRDRLRRRFIKISIRVVYVPEHGDLVAGETVEQVAEFFC